MKFLKKLAHFTETILEILAMSLLVLMTVIIGYQIFMRYFFSSTPKWSEELSLVLMVWFAFIGIAIGVNKGIHLSIEYFVDRMSPKAKGIIHKINDILIMTFGLVLTVAGYQLAEMAGMSIMPALQMPTTILYGVVPICGIMIVLYSLISFFTKRDFTDDNEEFDLFEGGEE